MQYVFLRTKGRPQFGDQVSLNETLMGNLHDEQIFQDSMTYKIGLRI
jgi:hypothetical protein